MTLYEALEKYTTPTFGGCTQFENIGNDILDTEESFKLYNLIRNVVSIKMIVSIKDVKLQSGFVLGSGDKKFESDDISEIDYELLEVLDLDKLPIYIRYKIADLLWIKKKRYRAAKVAFNSYLKLFDMPQEYETHTDILNTIYRAVAIAKKANNLEMCEAACKSICDKITDPDAESKGFFKIDLLEILVEQKISTDEFKVSEINKIIFDESSPFHLVEKANSLLERFYEIKKDSDALKSTRRSLAKLYESESEKMGKDNHQNISRAIHFLEKALEIYRSNKEPNEADRVQRKITELQSKLPNTFHSITQWYDVKKTYEYLENSFQELSFEESVLFLTSLTTFLSKEDVKNAIMHDFKEDASIVDFVTVSFIGNKGQTTHKLKSLERNTLEVDTESLDDRTYIHAHEYESKWGNFVLCKSLQIIQQSHSFSASDLDFLIKNNGFIPDGREQIFASAISMALHGQYYEAVHILAPQMENLFREIANELGDLTYTLDEDGTSEAKALSSVFNLPNLKDSLEEDILFVFEGLLDKKSGGNIRNEVAHGLLTEKNASSGVCIYFICAVIKLLSWGTLKSGEIMNDSKKLKSIEKLTEDMLPKRIKGIETQDMPLN